MGHVLNVHRLMGQNDSAIKAIDILAQKLVKPGCGDSKQSCPGYYIVSSNPTGFSGIFIVSGNNNNYVLQPLHIGHQIYSLALIQVFFSLGLEVDYKL